MDAAVFDPSNSSTSAAVPETRPPNAEPSGHGFQDALAQAQAEIAGDATRQRRPGAVALPLVPGAPDKQARKAGAAAVSATVSMDGSAAAPAPLPVAVAGHGGREGGSEIWTDATARSSSTHRLGQLDGGAESEVRAGAASVPLSQAHVEGGREIVAKSFGQAVDQARAAQGALPTGVAIQFPDPSWAVSGLDVALLADGAVDVILSIDRQALSTVSDHLDRLRRRLEAKGVSVAGIQLDTDSGGPAARGRIR